MTVQDPTAAVPRLSYAEYFRQSARLLGRWFVIFPVLGASAALLIGIVTFNFIAAFGIPDLFWRQTAPRMLLIGASLAVVFSLISFVGFLLESETRYVRERGITALGYYRRTFPWLTLLFLIGAMRFRFEPGVPVGGGPPTAYARAWVMVAGFALGVVIVALMRSYVLPAIWRFLRSRRTEAAISGVMQSSQENVPLHAYAIIVFAVTAMIYVALAIAVPHALPAAVAICILMAAFILAYGAIRFALPNLRLIVFALLVLLTGFITTRSPYKHRYPQFGAAAYKNPATIPPAGGGSNAQLIDNDAAFEAWLRSASNGSGTKPRLALVAASGGGIRAAVWTGSVLKELSESIPRFPRHLRLVTGASGGMVGGSFYAASVSAPQDGGDDSTHVAQFSALAQNSLDPVARYLALRDLPSLFLPGHFNDRGVALEEAWERNAPVMKARFAELAEGERAGWRPSIVLTPMLVEDGRRLLVSNLDLSFLTSTRGPSPGAPSTLYSRPSLELFRVLPEGRNELSVASAARMNASFSYVSPASEIPTSPRRHVVDAGYWDNYGVSLSVAWLEHNFEKVVQHTSGVVLIQIRDSVQQPANEDVAVPSEPGLPLAGYSEFTAPVVAALRARNSIMILRNDADVQAMARAFNTVARDPEFFTTVVIENPNPSVLSWSLTDQQAAAMLNYFDEPQHRDQPPVKAVEALTKWWARTPAAPIS